MRTVTKARGRPAALSRSAAALCGYALAKGVPWGIVAASLGVSERTLRRLWSEVELDGSLRRLAIVVSDYEAFGVLPGEDQPATRSGS